MKVREILEILEKESPLEYACDWDNAGLLVGGLDREVETVYLAVDATDEVIAEAISLGADLLLTHHPLLFHPLRRVREDELIGRRVLTMAEHRLNYIAMHTNFDVMPMADLAAERLGLVDCEPLEETVDPSVAGTRELGIGKIGNLPEEMTLEECCNLVKKAFSLEGVRIFADAADMTKKVSRISICPGCGKSAVGISLEKGAQVYVTGDIEHHDGIDGAARGMHIIDAGHYGIEKIFVPFMKEYLERETPNLTVYVREDKEPFLCK